MALNTSWDKPLKPLWESHYTEQDQTDLYVSHTCGSSATALGGAVTDGWPHIFVKRKRHIPYAKTVS